MGSLNKDTKALTFTIDSYSLKDISDSQLMELEMYVVSEGENRHKMPISRDAVINSADTFIGKPVLFKFNGATQDFMSHETDQIACGVCGLTKDDYYFKEVDGKLWLVLKAYLWKIYFEEVINVFKRDEKKAISMEMLLVDSEVDENDETLEFITSFCGTGVTLLGNIYNPAIPNANAKVIKYNKQNFSEMVEETKKLLFSHKSQDTNNNDEKEANKVADKFNKEEFAKTYSMTAMEMMEKFQTSLNGYSYKNGEYECKKYYVRDFCGTYVYARDNEQDTMVAIPYSFADTAPQLNFTGVKYAALRYVVIEIEPEIEPEGEPDAMQQYANKVAEEALAKTNEETKKELEKFEAQIADLEKSKSESDSKITEFESKTDDLKKEIETFSEKVKSLEDEKAELVTFKENVEKQAKEQRINFAIESVKDNLTEKQITEWKEKVDTFENVDAFTNAIQAFAYTQTKNIPQGDNQQIKFHIPQKNEDSEKSKGLWD